MELKPRYLLLAFGLHALLFALLFVSVLFQKKIQPPPSIEAVLIDPTPTPAPPPPKAEVKKPDPPKPPKPVEPPKPPPPKTEPKPEPPKPNPAKEMAQFKADVLLKLDCNNLTQMKMDAASLDDPNRRKIMEGLISDRYDACRKKEEDKKKKEAELAQKREEDQRKRDEAEIKKQFELEEKAEQKRVAEAQRQRAAAAAAAAAAAEAQRQRDFAAALGAEQAALDAKARGARQATWVDKIAAKVRPNVRPTTPPPKGTSCGVYVNILPDGSVQDVKITRRCTGNDPALDEAVIRAIYKSDPLPLPENPGDFDRNLRFNFIL